MGCYINPTDGSSKEMWLIAEGEPIGFTPPLTHRQGDKVVVCLVDNGWMTAAGICYDAQELRAFTQPTDLRPKKWYLVSIEKVKEFLRDREVAP